MSRLKPALRFTAHACRALSWLALRWPVFVLAFSIISPISPHVRVPNDYNCTYIGTHGFLIEGDDGSCPLVALIDTRDRGMW